MWSWNSMLITNDPSDRFSIQEMGYGIGNKFCDAGRDGYRLHFVIAGTGTYNGTTVCGGQYFLSFPFTQEEYYPDPENPWEYFWFALQGADVSRLLEENGIYNSVGPLRNFDKVQRFYRNIFLSDFQAVSSQQYAAACLNLLLSYVRPEEKAAQLRIVDLHVNRACSFIHSHYHLNITMEDIADFVHLDERYLYNIFKKRIGMPPKQYLSQKRYQAACSLLVYSKMPVAEIAESVGFSNAMYFSNFFKQHSGMSPSQYRRDQNAHAIPANTENP